MGLWLMVEFSKKSAPVSAALLTLTQDADTFGCDEWAWGDGQVRLSSSSSFTVAFVQVLMKSVREACNRPFSLACQKNKLSSRQWCWMSSAELFDFMLFYRARRLTGVFLLIAPSLINCNIVSYFWASASLLWHFATGRSSTKPRSGL